MYSQEFWQSPEHKIYVKVTRSQGMLQEIAKGNDYARFDTVDMHFNVSCWWSDNW